MNIHGILNLDKPEGPTSFQVVARVRRASGVKRVGHGGTLDPLASGVLPIFLGQATRLIEFLDHFPKVYRAEVELGTATDTYDAEGKTTFVGDASGVSSGQVQAALAAFRGLITQRPPAFSALKIGGRRLYSLARAGEPVVPPTRQVQVFRLDMVSWQPPVAVLEVECGRGTYIRSLAHDLGQALGCGAYLKRLVRTRVGPFTLDQAARLTDVEQAFLDGSWPPLLQPLDRPLDWMGAVRLDKDYVGKMIHGQDVSLPAAATTIGATEWVRAYTESGEFAALLRFQPDTGLWHPAKVFITFN